MRTASVTSAEAFLAELQAIKAMSLGLGEPIGRGRGYWAKGPWVRFVRTWSVSFDAFSHAHGQPSVGAREAAVIVETPPPAQGPSAARQDDGFAGVRLHLGSFGTDALGSFGGVEAAEV